MAAWLQAHNGIADSDQDPLEDRIITLWEKVGKEVAAAELEG
jgi:hypothetical protein